MKHIWIIHNVSSVNVFYRSYSDMKIDPDLVSGLLGALHNLSEVELHSSGIESINMGGLSWVYVEAPEFDLLFVAADEKGANTNVMRSRLEVIRDTFIQEFNLTPEKWKKEFKGDTGKYQSFAETLDTLISQWKEAERIMGAADLFDMLGVFQQIYNLYINLIKLNFFGEDYEALRDEITRTIEDLKSDPKFKDDPEIRKVSFDGSSGWNVITINPANVSAPLVESFLLRLTDSIHRIIMKRMGKMLLLGSLCSEMFPFILNNWGLIKKLGLDRKIMRILLLADGKSEKNNE